MIQKKKKVELFWKFLLNVVEILWNQSIVQTTNYKLQYFNSWFFVAKVEILFYFLVLA